MPRPSKGPTFRLRKYKDGRPAAWFIRDWVNGKRKEKGTGLGVGASESEKRTALENYLVTSHDPSPKSESDPHQALVADCLSVYVSKRLDEMAVDVDDRRGISRQKEVLSMERRLLKFFTTSTVTEVTGNLQDDYIKQRGSDSMARREMVMLGAAINQYTKKAGGVNLVFKPQLPENESGPRQRYLTRQEAAKLLRAAWRKRQTDRGGGEGRFTGKHNARAMLVGLYTGSRSGAICSAALIPTIGRGYVDLERGTFVRKKHGARQTNKNKNTAAAIDLPPRLLAHMRRWQRLGISRHSVVEWQGKAVQNTYRGFIAARDAAELSSDVVQHTLRHTAVSWYLRAGVEPKVVADYVGMTEAILRRTYAHLMPGAFKPIHAATNRFGRTA